MRAVASDLLNPRLMAMNTSVRVGSYKEICGQEQVNAKCKLWYLL